ncbi:MAG: hypothetical protein WCY75_11710 [Sulfurimonadaceae bacterium]
MSKKVCEFKDNSQTKHLLWTFDYFDYFINHQNKTNPFNLKICIDTLIDMIEPLLGNNFITVYNNCQEIYLKEYESEITVALLNILNNSLYELTKNKTHRNRYIFINAYTKNGFVTIEIKDSRENINTHTILKQFTSTLELKNNPDTRLFFSHKIIQETIKGELYVEKSTQVIKDETLDCVNFIIKIKECPDE